MADLIDDGIFIVDDPEDRIPVGYDQVVAYVNYTLKLEPGASVARMTAAPGTLPIWLSGDAFPNLLVGNDGDNTLDGGGGVDTLIGGAGSDTYIVHNSLDQVIEQIGGGYDIVLTSVHYALNDSSEVEGISASGIDNINLGGNSLSNIISGNIGKNILKGFAGDDKIYGDGGNDKLYGGIGNDTLYGGRGNDALYGEAGNDKLYGDVGNDTLSGGAGNDMLYGGTGSDIMRGGAGKDVLYGDAGNDKLYGDAGNDKLYGGAGNNTLSGGTGNDTLYGSFNNDMLLGGSGNDRIFGDSGNDRISGGSGNDILSGGEGYDTFLFDAALNANNNVDTITDLNIYTDRIALKASVFGGIGGYGVLSEAAFWVGTRAHAASDRIIYDRDAGVLYFDPDGTGAAQQIKFAKVGYLDLKSTLFDIV